MSDGAHLPDDFIWLMNAIAFGDGAEGKEGDGNVIDCCKIAMVKDYEAFLVCLPGLLTACVCALQPCVRASGVVSVYH